jgi:phosphotriesterase-related protein
MDDTVANAGTVMSIDGPVDPEDLGITLVHEHLLIDLRAWQHAPRTDAQKKTAGDKLAMHMLGEVRRDPYVFEDNLRMDDRALAAREIGEFVALGGRTVVDVTNKGLGQDVRALREIARAAGVRVVAGSGYYVQPSHPPEVARQSVETLAEAMLDEIVNGIDGSDIRPGVIGEIGTGDPVHADEWKVLAAACIAQRHSGLPLSVHVDPMQAWTAPDVVGRILDAGVPAAKVIVCHMDGNMDLDYQVRVAETGVFVSYDCFGLEVYFDCHGRYRCHDSERERVLLQLLARGYESQILLSQDVCMKAQLREYGGYGYDHVLRHILPSLRRQGVSEQTLSGIIIDNPARALTIG